MPGVRAGTGLNERLRLPKKLDLCFMSGRISFGTSSSSSSVAERIRRTSDVLWMVVEMLIWPPMKKQSLPLVSYRGARHVSWQIIDLDCDLPV